MSRATPTAKLGRFFYAMISNELRIGNYIKLGKEFVRVFQIIYNRPNGFSINHVDTTIDLFEPISITPEILKKCEFLECFGGLCINPTDNICIFIDFKTMEFSMTIDEPEYIATTKLPILKSVHQLQNIHFALTGTELEINL